MISRWLLCLVCLGIGASADAQTPSMPQSVAAEPGTNLASETRVADRFDGHVGATVSWVQDSNRRTYLNDNPTRASKGARRPYWGNPHIVVTDPTEYPRPRSLDHDDPNSFWYSLRPNIFNVPISDEWDFYNIINTDRPDFTDAVYSVGKGVSVSENGYTFHKINDAATHVSIRQLPESLLRYGLTDEFELRFKWNGYLMTDIKDQATGAQVTGFGGEDLELGVKYELLQQRGWRPMTTIVSGMLVPTGTRGVSAHRAEPHCNLIWGWGIRRWLYIKVQTGVDILHVSNTQVVSTISSVAPGFVTTRAGQNSWHQSISILTQWTKRVGAFHEWFMISNTRSGDTRGQHFLDMGAYIYATPNVQFDIRVGKRVSDRVNDVFAGAGLSLRW